MSDCSQHKKDLFGETDMKKVAEAIGDLNYETLVELLELLEIKLKGDGLRDKCAGKKKLGDCLLKAANKVGYAAFYIDDAWQISKPFMTNNQNKG